MGKKKEKKLTLKEVYSNNLYAMKLGYNISKSRVLHALLMRSLGYFEWVFFSAFFMRYIVDALDKKREFSTIFTFILICGGVFILLNLYNNYAENVIYPLTATRLYYGIYKKLYTKAKNVELRCYEDSDFYNRYTMAIDNAGDKITAVIDNLWGIVTGSIATIVVYYSMFEIDPYVVLFVISPIIGNFLFGNYKINLNIGVIRKGFRMIR